MKKTLHDSDSLDRDPRTAPRDRCRLVIVGLGALGAMALREAAGRGVDVVGVEPFESGHDWGASGGQTRIFRMAYKEGAEYLPLLRESLERWEELQSGAAQTLWQRTGALTIGSPEDPEVATVLRSVSAGRLPARVVPPEEARERWPQHRLLGADIVVHDPQGGLLRPAAAIRAAVADARAHGGELVTGRRVEELREDPGGVVLSLSDGTTLAARKAIVATGPWVGELVPSAREAVELRRVILHWYPTTDGSVFSPQDFPVGIRRSGPGRAYSFFPQLDSLGVKVNFHVPKQVVPAMTVPTSPLDPAYTERVSRVVPEVFDGVRPAPAASAAFVEGYTPTGRPVVSRVPATRHVWVTAGGSGHAFKMAPALARLVVDAALGDAAIPKSAPVTALRSTYTEARS